MEHLNYNDDDDDYALWLESKFIYLANNDDNNNNISHSKNIYENLIQLSKNDDVIRFYSEKFKAIFVAIIKPTEHMIPLQKKWSKWKEIDLILIRKTWLIPNPWLILHIYIDVN